MNPNTFPFHSVPFRSVWNRFQYLVELIAPVEMLIKDYPSQIAAVIIAVIINTLKRIVPFSNYSMSVPICPPIVPPSILSLLPDFFCKRLFFLVRAMQSAKMEVNEFLNIESFKCFWGGLFFFAFVHLKFGLTFSCNSCYCLEFYFFLSSKLLNAKTCLRGFDISTAKPL